MYKVHLKIKAIHNLPLLGLSTHPNPYIMMQCQNQKLVTGICKATRNPTWQFETTIKTNNRTCPVNLYIFNSNANETDELLCSANIEFNELLTQVNTKTKIRLRNVQTMMIGSILFVQHFDQNAKEVVLSSNHYIKIFLLNTVGLSHDFTLSFYYANNGFCLKSPHMLQNTFKYQPKEENIIAVLTKPNKTEIKQQIGVKNITQCIYKKIIFYDHNQSYEVNLSLSLIECKGIPAEYNCLRIKLLRMYNRQGKDIVGKVVMHGPFGQSSMDLNSQGQIYVQENSLINLHYNDDPKSLSTHKPTHKLSFVLSSIDWNLAQHTFKFYNPIKATETNLHLKFAICKVEEPSKIIPVLNSKEPIQAFDYSILVQKIIINNAYFWQVFPKDTLFKLIHVSLQGTINCTTQFKLQQSSTYTILTNLVLRNEGRGILYLLTFSHVFSNVSDSCTHNHEIGRLIIDKISEIDKLKMQFNSKFLSFAKKSSLSKVCKQFNQMIHENFLQFNCKFLPYYDFHAGILKVINCRIQGTLHPCTVEINADGNNFKLQGQPNQFLMRQSYLMSIKENSLEVKCETAKQYCYYFDFNAVLSTMSNNYDRLYLWELKLAEQERLQIIYAYNNSVIEQSKPKYNQTMQQMSGYIPIGLKLIKAEVKCNCQYTVRVSKGSTVFESLVYTPNTSTIRFKTSQKIFYKAVAKNINQEENFIFFSMYCSQQNQLVIYNGHLDVRSIVGKGYYELLLKNYNKLQDSGILMTVEILNDKPIQCPQITMVLSSIDCAKLSIFKNKMRYYLKAEVDSCCKGLYQGIIKSNQNLTFQASLCIRYGDCINWKLFSSAVPLTQQKIDEAEKHLIGYAYQRWQLFCQGDGELALNFNPSEQMNISLKLNELSLLQHNMKLNMHYKIILKQFIETTQPQIKLSIEQNLDIDVLSRGIVVLNLKQFTPFHQNYEIIKYQIQPIHYNFICHTKHHIYQQVLIDAINLQFKIQVNCTYRINQGFEQLSVCKSIHLKGKHIKTKQNFVFSVVLKDMCRIKCGVMVLSNRFTTNPYGTLYLSQISTNKNLIQSFDLKLIDHPSQIKSASTVYKIDTKNPNLGIELKTTSAVSCLHILLNNGVNLIIRLAEIKMNRFSEQQFIYVKQVQLDKETVIELSFKGNYIAHKIHSEQSKVIIYYDSKSQLCKEEVQYHKVQQIILMSKAMPITNAPKRKPGFRIIVNTPKRVQIRKVLVKQNQTKGFIPLKKSYSKQNEFYINSESSIRINELIINDYRAQNLGYASKFIVHEYNSAVCEAKVSKYQIGHSGGSNWIIEIQVHRLITQGKRLLQLKNSPNDEILTTEYGIRLTHGEQIKFVYGFQMNGQSLKIPQLLQFGYDANYDEIEIDLFIQHYFNNQQSQQIQLSNTNWTQFMPVCHGVIELEQIHSSGLFKCVLVATVNDSQTLDSALSSIIIRNDISLLGHINYSNRNWGYIDLKLLGISELRWMANYKPQRNILLYLRIAIEGNNQQILKQFLTQCREIRNNESIIFTPNSLNIFLIQPTNIAKNLLQYNIKVNGYIIDGYSHQNLFQKRLVITDKIFIQGQSEFNVQIKSNDNCNLLEMFQLTFKMSNGNKNKKNTHKNMNDNVENIFDIVSFKQHKQVSMLKVLIQSQHQTHFYEILSEIKQSFIYKSNQQLWLMQYLSEYLSWQFNHIVVDEVLEIIQITLIKYPYIRLTKQWQNRIYSHFKRIAKTMEKSVPLEVKNYTLNEYNKMIEGFNKDYNINSFITLIEYQSNLLFNGMQILKSAKLHHCSTILQILFALLKNSNELKIILNQELQQWLELCMYKQEKQFTIFLKLFNQLQESTSIQIQSEFRVNFIKVLQKKKYNFVIVVNCLNKLSNFDVTFINQMILTYTGQLRQLKQIITICKGFKLLISHFNKTSIWNEIKCNELIEVLKGVLKQKICEFASLGAILDLIIFLHEYGVLSEQDRMHCIKCIQNEQNNSKQNSFKLLYSNCFQKIKIVKEQITSKKQTNSNYGSVKYKKYLITTD